MLEPESLYRLQFASDPRISSDGRVVAYVLTRVEDEGAGSPGAAPRKGYRSSVWLSRDGAPAAQFTAGASRDSSPRLSPDASRLAFLSRREGEKNQLYVMPLSGGEARPLTRLKSGVSSPAWSPDGRTVAFVSRGDFHDSRGEEGTPRVVERLQYKANGVGGPGFRFEEPAQLWAVDVDGGEPRPLTEHPADIGCFDWLPDGSGLVFVAAPDPDEEALWRAEAYLVSRDGGEARRLTDWGGLMADPRVSPDGRRVAVVAGPDDPHRAHDPHLYVFDLPPEGGPPARPWRLDEGFDFPLGDWVGTDGHFGDYSGGPLWTADGSVLALYTLGGAGALCRVSPDGAVARLVHAEGENLSSLDAAPGGECVFTRSTPFGLDEVYLWRGGAEVRLSAVNDAALGDVALSPGLERLVLERDGYTVEGWVMKPVGWTPEGRYPVLLQVHGGPHTAYGYGYYHEMQLLASRGFAQVYANIRGSVGYGEAQTAATTGAYGQGDFEDLMAFFDAALGRFPWLDAKRAGVIGGSYGGFMTNWIIAHTTRFAAAVTDRSICNWLSFYGTSDIGYKFTPRELPTAGEDDLAALWDFSPLKHAHRVKTPTLIIHAEEDHRCPVEQAEQWFVALKRRGVEVRFVRFPGESHELSRSGRPDRRVVRLAEIVAWFEKHLR